MRLFVKLLAVLALAPALCSAELRAVAGGGGGGTPGGTNGQVQYNNNGAFGGYTTIPQSNILTCAANQLVYDNISATLTCGPLLTFDGTNFTVGSPASGLINTSFTCSNDPTVTATDSGCWVSYTDQSFTHSASISWVHFSTSPDSLATFNSLCVGGNGCDFMSIYRSNVSGACAQGVVSAMYQPCGIRFGTVGGLSTIWGPLNPSNSGGSKDLGYRFRGTANDSIGFLFGNHVLGTEAYQWLFDYSYSTNSNQRIGHYAETIPSAATSAASAQHAPKCGLTIPYRCDVWAPNVNFGISDGNSSSDIGGLNNITWFFDVTKTIGTPQAVVTVGDNVNATSVTNIVAGSAANTQANGLQIATISAGGAVNKAYSQLSYQPGLVTSIVNTKSVYSSIVAASTVDSIVGSAQSLTTCTTNPTITMYECGTDASCASPTTIGSVTITATGQAFKVTPSSSAITAGDYVGWAISAGACASLDIGATAQVHTN